MRALFIYKFLTMGGVETVLRARLEGLRQRGIDAQVWFLFDGPGRVIFEDVSSQVHVGSTRLLHDFLLAEPFDLLSSLDTEEVFPVVRRLREKPKFVIEVHSPYIENLAYLQLAKDILVDAYFVPSRYQAEVVKKLLQTSVDVRVIPNPLASNFSSELAAFSPAPPRPIVAWIGRLDDLKNWKEYIDIGARLRKYDLEVEFWIVGTTGGEDISRPLYTQAKRAGIHDRLKWFRGVPHAHMPTLLDAVRSSGGVVVSTSKGDSFGMTIAEGMARACAVVVPSKGPFNEFVKEGVHGRVYDLGSAEDGARQIMSLLEDDEFRMKCGERGRKSILERHSPEAAVTQLVLELKQIIDQ